MPDDPTTPAAEGETPPAATSTATTTTAPPETVITTVPAGDEHDPARAKALIDKLREKEKAGDKAAKELAAAQAKLDAIEAEKLTEAERLQKERDEAVAARTALDSERREDRIRLAVYGQRDALGLASADLAIAALDRSQVQFDDQGQPTNVADLLTALIEREPILKGTPAKPAIPSTDGGAGGGGSAPDLTADELEAARATGQSPERFAALKRVKGAGQAIKVTDAIAALTKQ